MLKIVRSDDRKALASVLRSREIRFAEAERVAERIVSDVRRHGDRSLIRLSRKFDHMDLVKSGFTVGRPEVREAYKHVPDEFIKALRVAAGNIRATASRQLPSAWRVTTMKGVVLQQIVRPLERVACYVPGGRFPLPSTVLMSVIPAQVAGVREIVLTSPCPAPSVLVAADYLGVKTIFRLGGAQAVAAFAYGTDSVPRVDKIVGPGNRYVAAAKKVVAGECGIDFIAGPTELVVAGARGNPDWIAAELVAQAEHDPDAVGIFITPSKPIALQVQRSAETLVRQLAAANAEKSLRVQGAIIVTQDLAETIELVNLLAPEHLTLLDDTLDMLDRVQSAGSIFLGGYSPVAAGDYASGTNHILPTGGAARVRGGLSAADFVKTISVQQLSRAGLSRLRKSIVALAEAEGLKAHAKSVEARFSPDGR
jgi:histidinol dehydrogenase